MRFGPLWSIIHFQPGRKGETKQTNVKIQYKKRHCCFTVSFFSNSWFSLVIYAGENESHPNRKVSTDIIQHLLNPTLSF